MESLLFFCSRTLSNWAYEFDKWAPSVVKVSYKASIVVQIFISNLSRWNDESVMILQHPLTESKLLHFPVHSETTMA